MKKNIIYLLITIGFSILVFKAKCQSAILWGENWTNVPENLTPAVIADIVDRTPPGGTYFACFRNDKYAEDKNGLPGPDKAPQIEIENVIALNTALKNDGKRLGLEYTFDTRGRCSVSDAFFAYDKFITAGIWIPAVRGGNEEYAKVAGHSTFSHYSALLGPIESALNTRGFTGWIFIPLNRYNDTGKNWNTDAAAYSALSPNRAGDIHFYWNETFAPSLSALQVDAAGERYLPSAISTRAGYLTLQDNFYRDSYFEVIGSTYIQDQMNWYNTFFPGKPCSITEYGPIVGVGPLQGALGYNAAEDWFCNQIKDRTDIFCACKFNGPGTPTGSESKRGKLDDPSQPTMVKRLSYYTQLQFLRNINSTPVPDLITQPGEYCFSIHNMVRAELSVNQILNLSGVNIESYQFECLTGPNYYTSAGQMSWWQTGSEKTYDISGPQFFDYIPALSYGYLHVTLVPACRDSIYFVNDTTYSTIQVANPLPVKCSRFFYSLFHRTECTVTYHTEQQMIITRKEITETICE